MVDGSRGPPRTPRPTKDHEGRSTEGRTGDGRSRPWRDGRVGGAGWDPRRGHEGREMDGRWVPAGGADGHQRPTSLILGSQIPRWAQASPPASSAFHRSLPPSTPSCPRRSLRVLRGPPFRRPPRRPPASLTTLRALGVPSCPSWSPLPGLCAPTPPRPREPCYSSPGVGRHRRIATARPANTASTASRPGASTGT